MHLGIFSWTLALSVLTPLVHSVPSANLDYSPYSRSSRHGIRGADAITAAPLNMGHADSEIHEGNYYVASSVGPGLPGEAIVTDDKNPTTFFIKSGQLFAYVNQTTVLHVNVIKTTIPAPIPHGAGQTHYTDTERPTLMKVLLGPKKVGIEGEFFWSTSALFFRARGSDAPKNSRWQRGVDSLSNAGLWWACEYKDLPGGRRGRAIYLDFGSPDYRVRDHPIGCKPWTFHALGTPEDGY